ncbi:hypothetical protein N9878_02270 [bacterium]|nr:hypothetical protein [bacterium]
MITTQKQLRIAFWESHSEYSAERRSRNTQNDYRAGIRTAWCDFVDQYRECSLISEALADRATL